MFSTPPAMGQNSFRPSPDDEWTTYRRLAVYNPLFFKGVGAVVPEYKASSESGRFENGGVFPLTSRQLVLGYNPKQSKSIRKAYNLLGPLQALCANLGTRKFNSQAVISNPQRREECFVPLIVTPDDQNDQELFGLYVYPWLSKNISLNFQL